MSITQTNMIAKIAAVVAGLGLVAMSFVSAVPAKAADADLSAQIAALQAQLAALMSQAGSTGACTSFMANLTVGSRGADVSALQTWLIGKGFSIPAGATGYFGAQSKAALAAYQASVGITPAVGYFGPITRAKVNALGCTTGNGGSTGGNVTLTGNGRLTNVSTSSLGDVTTDINEGDGPTKVVGISADATDGDVQIQRLDVNLVIGSSGTQSSSISKYVSDVAVYLDGKKLASMSASSGDKDGRTWSYRFANLNGVIKNGNTGNIYVEVTPVTSVGSDEDGKGFTATIPTDGLRAVGADGLSETYVTSLSQTGITISSSDNGTLTVTAANDNPKASQVAVASSTTSGVTLLSFNLKAKNQDVTISSLPVQLGTSDSLSDVIQTVKLMKGSTVVKSKTVSSGTFGTTTFDNLNETINEDQTATYSIVADLKGDSAYADGTTVVASTTVYGWDVSDAGGATVTPSAGAAGNTQTLTATGITVTKGTMTATVATGLANAGDIASYVLPFTVTAGDDDVFIVGSATKGAANSAGIAYGTTTTSTSGATGEPTANVSVSDTVTGDSAGSYYKVLAGTSRVFTLNVALTATTTGATTAGYEGIILNSIEYGATNAGNSYYTSNLDTFKTNDVYVTKR